MNAVFVLRKENEVLKYTDGRFHQRCLRLLATSMNCWTLFPAHIWGRETNYPWVVAWTRRGSYSGGCKYLKNPSNLPPPSSETYSSGFISVRVSPSSHSSTSLRLRHVKKTWLGKIPAQMFCDLKKINPISQWRTSSILRLAKREEKDELLFEDM